MVDNYRCPNCGGKIGFHRSSCPLRPREGYLFGFPIKVVDDWSIGKIGNIILAPFGGGLPMKYVGRKVRFRDPKGLPLCGIVDFVDRDNDTILVEIRPGQTEIVSLTDDSLYFFPEKEKGRMSRQTYFMKIAGLVSQRTTCLHRQVGAVLVLDNHILSTGYNGAPVGMDHCNELGCAREGEQWGRRLDLCRASHAEINAICFAARHGTAIAGATLYTTTFPCGTCAKAILNAGIIQVVYHHEYFDEMGYEILRRIEVELYRGEKDQSDAV